jgi:hypothetical protein
MTLSSLLSRGSFEGTARESKLPRIINVAHMPWRVQLPCLFREEDSEAVLEGAY